MCRKLTVICGSGGSWLKTSSASPLSHLIHLSPDLFDFVLFSFGRTRFGRDVWTDELLPRIKDTIVYGLQPAQDNIEHRKNSFELFGFDIMVDENMRPWLIEINSSPSMDKVCGQ
jgi:hypothetical protein